VAMKAQNADAGAGPEGGPERRVSARQRYAIDLLLDGGSDAHIARMVGIRGAQLRAWKENPRFREAWGRARLRRALNPRSTLVPPPARPRPEPETPWMSRHEKEEKDG
jgi:hypothetical protein